jgi:hypothetical protein
LNLGHTYTQVNFTVDIRAMDDKVRETIVMSFSRLVFQKCEDRLVDCAVEHKVILLDDQQAHKLWYREVAPNIQEAESIYA